MPEPWNKPMARPRRGRITDVRKPRQGAKAVSRLCLGRVEAIAKPWQGPGGAKVLAAAICSAKFTANSRSSIFLLLFFFFHTQEEKKKFEKQTAKFIQSQERHLNLSTKKQDAVLQEVNMWMSIVSFRKPVKAWVY